DTAFGGGLLVDDAGNVGISGPAEWASREQAAALDMNDPANRDRVLAAGREGLRRVEAMQADAARRRALDAELRMTPEMRLERDVEVAKETGLNRRAQLESDTNLAAAGARAASDRAAAQSEAAK